jgi:amidase
VAPSARRKLWSTSPERIQAINPLDAVADVLADQALVAAQAADAARRRGGLLGPLHRVSVALKVNIDTQRRATTNDVVAFKDHIASEDSASGGQPAQGRRGRAGCAWR